jgi:hypothetical protein
MAKSKSTKSLKSKTTRRAAKLRIAGRPEEGRSACLKWLREIVLAPAIESFIGDPPDDGYSGQWIATLLELDSIGRRLANKPEGAASRVSRVMPAMR